ncbi:hypothetical protein [Moorena sp. SIO3I6]|uniref:hypothetical protein n=1 Tax=Moorena sp. SIO3I6 TaxID=2607831 RepID=UPI0013F95396|nr:hypothetical protein [Moorena sp. SIO3I6]NEP21328.1 hypothetical protein [Moorena sp. SIO3I6]
MGGTTAIASGGTTAIASGGTTAIASGGDPQDRAASPRPRCLPKTALAPQDRTASLHEGAASLSEIATFLSW